MMARRNSWVFLVTIFTIIVYVYSEQEIDPDHIQNDQEVFSLHAGNAANARMTRGRNGGGGGGLGGFPEITEEERGLPREERKRIKAERRRLKEERRQERWARRRQQNQEGYRSRFDEVVSEEPPTEGRGMVLNWHHPNISRGVPVTLSSSSASSSGVSGSSGGLPAPHSVSTESSGSSNSLAMASSPTVVDLEWLRANLSSLWSVVRTLTKQGRHYLQRGGGGGRGRHHHSGVPAVPHNPESCRGEEDRCREAEGGEICGGKGVCMCGGCSCDPGHYGSYCQCYDHSCPLYDGMMCGGPSRGQCRCDTCICRAGYTGESCDCPLDIQTCTPPDSDRICSNNGACVCGRCRCDDGYKGMYCEDNVYAAGVCEKLKSCVMCKAWKRDIPSCAQCQITVTTVESLEPSMTTCVMVNSGCLLQFSYIPQTAQAYTVLVPRDMVCP